MHNYNVYLNDMSSPRAAKGLDGVELALHACFIAYII